MEFFLLFWVTAIILGAAIGSSKGQTATGVVLGALLGWLGVIITCFLKDLSVEED